MTASDAVAELQRRRSTLINANADSASPRLVSILDWLCREAVTKKIVEKLISVVDESKVFQTNRRTRIVASTPEEIAFAGYALMTNCRQHSFWRWCTKYDVRGPSGSSNVNEITRAGISEYIEPFFDYVEAELISMESNTTIASIVETRMAAFLDDSIAHMPNTSGLIHQIAAEFSRSDSDVHWQNVGNSCREALKSAIRELVQVTGSTLPAEVQLGNVKRVAELLIGESVSSDSRGTLSKLVAAAWDHAQSVTHREATTKEDAVRLFVWTTLAMNELATLCSRSGRSAKATPLGIAAE